MNERGRRTYVCKPAAATVVDAYSSAIAAEKLSSIIGEGGTRD